MDQKGYFGVSRFWEKGKETFCAPQRYILSNLGVRKGEAIADENGDTNPKPVERLNTGVTGHQLRWERGLRTSHERQRQDYI